MWPAWQAIMAQLQAMAAGWANAGHVELRGSPATGRTDQPPPPSIESCRRGDDGQRGVARLAIAIEVGEMDITATIQPVAGGKGIAAQGMGIDRAMGKVASAPAFTGPAVGLIGEEVIQAVHCRNLAGG